MKTRKKLYKIIICLICAEFIFTSLGFCGHDHHHKQYDLTPALQHLPTEQSDFHHFHSSSSHKKENESSRGKQYHCSCLGNFLSSGILQMYSIKLSFTDFIYQEIAVYVKLFEESFFRPPKNI